MKRVISPLDDLTVAKSYYFICEYFCGMLGKGVAAIENEWGRIGDSYIYELCEIFAPFDQKTRHCQNLLLNLMIHGLNGGK
jgi:hypothetical protein